MALVLNFLNLWVVTSVVGLVVPDGSMVSVAFEKIINFDMWTHRRISEYLNLQFFLVKSLMYTSVFAF